MRQRRPLFLPVSLLLMGVGLLGAGSPSCGGATQSDADAGVDAGGNGQACAALGEQACRSRADCVAAYSAGIPAMPADGGASTSYLSCSDRRPCPAMQCAACAAGTRAVVDGSGCATCECRPVVCPDVLCALACPDGFAKDQDGCDLCRCKGSCPPPLPCPLCANGYLTGADGCFTCACKPSVCEGPPVCNEMCVQGTIPTILRDPSGCERCECLPRVCDPPVCAVACVAGTVPTVVDGPGGCPHCTCRPPPGCAKDADCPSGEVCSLPEPAYPPGVEYPLQLGTCTNTCRADADCEAGLTCQPDPGDPCNSGKVECFAPGRRVCLPPPPRGCTADAQCPAGQLCSIPPAACPACGISLGTCVEPCDTAATCPAGQACLPDPNDVCNNPAADCFRRGRTICSPEPAGCTADAQCAAGDICSIPPSTCPVGYPCPLRVGVCQRVCRSDADCGAGFSCQPDPNDPCNSDPTIQCLVAGRKTCLAVKR